MYYKEREVRFKIVTGDDRHIFKKQLENQRDQIDSRFIKK